MYCEEHSTPLPQDLERHKKFTRDNFLDHDKMVSSLEAQLFIFLAKNQKAKRSNPTGMSLCVLHICTTLPRLLCPPLQLGVGCCQILALFCSYRTIALMVVLEIGCYSGYSALAWAEALKNVPEAEVSHPIPDPLPSPLSITHFISIPPVLTSRLSHWT